MGERKTFATTIDTDVTRDFKLACVKNGAKMNDVLEALMAAYADGSVSVSHSVSIPVVSSQNK